MFSSNKENAPLKGGWSLFFKRLLLRNKTFTFSLIAFGIFVLTVGALSSSGIKDQKAETNTATNSELQLNGGDLQQKLDEIKRREEDLKIQQEELQQLSREYNKKQDENEEKVQLLEKQIADLKNEVSQLKKSPKSIKEDVREYPFRLKLNRLANARSSRRMETD